jgi:hypothetical protein
MIFWSLPGNRESHSGLTRYLIAVRLSTELGLLVEVLAPLGLLD